MVEREINNQNQISMSVCFSVYNNTFITITFLLTFWDVPKWDELYVRLIMKFIISSLFIAYAMKETKLKAHRLELGFICSRFVYVSWGKNYTELDTQILIPSIIRSDNLFFRKSYDDQEKIIQKITLTILFLYMQ